ncbi:hypothetical protein DEO72_LG10g2415 [Vigna unguiculata]|uniref:Uncharacterized protein n=1 Tax=Vigna unguiculata TaxID=3917 RepID=A0A4D6NE72_VIGUN|nr:hypothetical protein DEO72_LG10g2415 [Vigna unguiculata]
MCDFAPPSNRAIAIAIEVRSILPLPNNCAIATFISCSSFHVRGGGLRAGLMGFNPRSGLCLRSQKKES